MRKYEQVEMEGAGAAAAIDQAGSQGIPTRFMMIRGISDVAAAFIMGWIGTGCPVRHRLNHWFVNRHRNRSESSVFYSCRFSFSGLVAAKLAMVIGI